MAILGISLFITSCAMNTEAGAIVTARKVVEKSLRAPTTATYSNEKVLGRKGDLFLVQLTVDAQNAFGARIRNYFLVVLEVKSNGKYYTKPQVAAQEFDHEPTSLDISFAKSLNGWDNWELD